jgi:nickel transport protein
MRLNFYVKLLITLLFLNWLPAVHAHKVKLFATVIGDKIEGYVYFPGGERAQSVTVKITFIDNRLVETVTTNEHGEFQFHVKCRATYRLIADIGEGHFAEYIIDSNELSDSLPTLATEKQPAVSAPPAAMNQENQSFSQQQLIDLIEKSVSKQLKPLREQLEAYQEKIFIHDVLGGVGYIFGVMGLLFYIAKRRSH